MKYNRPVLQINKTGACHISVLTRHSPLIVITPFFASDAEIPYWAT